MYFVGEDVVIAAELLNVQLKPQKAWDKKLPSSSFLPQNTQSYSGIDFCQLFYLLGENSAFEGSSVNPKYHLKPPDY